ncbi:MAG: TatD family hydrolase [Spirochaetes bacterium]|nr:TatD family hydrolase [Spirochaetota bacterium]
MEIIDSHCHLQDPALFPHRAGIIARAKNAGVTYMLTCGTSPEDWQSVCDIAHEYSGIIPAFGVHPHKCDSIPADWEKRLIDMLGNTKSAVGEIGLDFAEKGIDRTRQQAIFIRQMEIARELKRPVSIHARQCWDVMPALLEKYAHDLIIIIHSCSASRELIPRLTDGAIYCSFSGTLTYSRNKRAHDAVRAVPRDRLLIESDAPDLPPVINGAVQHDVPNEPGNITATLKSMAVLRVVDEDTMAGTLLQNTLRALTAVMS